jgi:hypothetical protein
MKWTKIAAIARKDLGLFFRLAHGLRRDVHLLPGVGLLLLAGGREGTGGGACRSSCRTKSFS